MSEQLTYDDAGGRKPSRIVLGLAGGLILAAIVGVYAVLSFVGAERERDLRAWQIRLGIVADSRAAAVNEWIEAQFRTLQALAENESLQLYMTELSLAQGDKTQVTDEAAQAGYLRNLLIATAERDGFADPTPASQVAANVQRLGIAGVGLVDAEGKPLVATPGMPPLAGRLKDSIARLPAAERGIVDLHLGANEAPTMGFVVPVFGIQSDRGASSTLGLIVGVKIVGKDLYGRLAQPGETEKTAETYLVRQNGPNVEYLSPLADGTAPLKRTLALDTPGLDAAHVLKNAGAFAIRADHAGDEVLVAGRALASVPWMLVRKVARREALADTDDRLTTMLVVFLLLIGVMTVTLVAVWRHGTSLRAAAAADRFRIAAERFQNLGKFLRIVTDGQPTAIAALDASGHYTFANKAAAAGSDLEPDDLRGKSMAAVMGPVKAKIYEEVNKQVLAQQIPLQATNSFEEDAGTRIYHSDHIPLKGDRDHPPGVLMIVEDITDLVSERQRRERTLRQLVSTLVTFVDRRDPYSANHSTRVAEVARAIAQEMNLAEGDIRTIDIAGNLMNLGKLLVPRAVLTKTANLSEDEIKLIRNSVLTSAELIDGIEFDGPVVETIRQIQEHWDGTGSPKGLKGESILVPARVVAVANAFVGMVSARAYRAGVPFDKACSILTGEAGTTFDRRAVSALVNFVENRGGRTAWAKYAERPAA